VLLLIEGCRARQPKADLVVDLNNTGLMSRIRAVQAVYHKNLGTASYIVTFFADWLIQDARDGMMRLALRMNKHAVLALSTRVINQVP
jgi:hypothetical protein